MEKMAKTTAKKKKTGELYRNFIQLVLVGSITGIFGGAIVTLFNILAHEGEHISQNAYAYVRSNPAFIPLLFLALIGGAFLIGVAVNISSVIRGCAIPQTEGATRGIVPLKWWRDLTLMFACSLLSIFMGLSIGAEGPSVLIGACTGDGVSSGLRRNQMIRKYQITGGACVGLAVASNAPLTGMAFAFEEAYKRLTPEVFICSATSVITGMLTKHAIYWLRGEQILTTFASYRFFELPIRSYGFVLLAGIACGLLGVAFYRLAFFMRKLFKKIRVKDKNKLSHGLRIAVAVLLGGTVSLIAAGVMGGGHGLIESIGTLGGVIGVSAKAAFGLGLVWTLLIILLLKMLITTVNIGSGIPCGIFIPIIAIGACLGALLNTLWLKMGMDKLYCDLMVMICMAAFFTTVVKAPITSIVMICEFTGSFAHLLPVIIAVFIGYFIGEMFRTDGIYEELLEQYEKETNLREWVREVFTFTVQRGALAEKREVRDILWPQGARVTELIRGEEKILPDGDTVLHGGDVLTVICKTDNPDKAREELEHILG
ncbi:MAG: chloride channel protein [Clostridia bacterium]|nr:chloride channel protein [Clostridia bacterium]